jgi:molybdopterin/thiamine biosynthesis adenylyltransferase
MVAEQLGRLGVGRLVLIDPDVVEESNLPRIVGAIPEQVGQEKVNVLEQHLQLGTPDTEIVTVSDRVQNAEDQLADVDVILAGVDRVSARIFLNEYAVSQQIPYIDAGCIIHSDNGLPMAMRGYVQTVVPNGACLDCLGRLDIERARLEHMDREEVEAQVRAGYVPEDFLNPEPSIIYLNGVVASIAVNKAVGLVTGRELESDLIRYDGLQEDLARMKARPSEECPTCRRFT